MRIEIPDGVRQILERLNRAGHEAYAVGGCVRDALLGRVPNDWDITTSALPGEVKGLFKRTIDTGLQHGTVTVLVRGSAFEVTTYRIDGIYEDSRHPKAVTFTPELTEDLRRRDFTINAMAWHPDRGLVDPFGGRADLEARCIRAVGDPAARFDEDALRILRAVRFAAQLDFSIEPATFAALRDFAPRLTRISCERIREELVKLLVSGHPDQLRLLYETGITAVILPFFDEMMTLPQHNPAHLYSVGEHTLVSLRHVAPEPVLRLAMLLHDAGKVRTHTTDATGTDHFYGHAKESTELAERWMREYKFDNATIDAVRTLVRWHDYPFGEGHDVRDKEPVRRALNRVGTALFPSLLAVMRADTMAKSEAAKALLLPALDIVEQNYREILADAECFSLKDLAVSGRDLIAAGKKPGPELGRILDALLDEVLEDPGKNTREYLLARAAEL